MPLPKGYVLDQPQTTAPKLPKGYTLDQPAPSLPAGATGPLPGVPRPSVPAGLQGPPPIQPPAPKFGTIVDTIGNVGTHLKNMVAGPVQAFTAPPSNPTEQGIAAGTANIPGGSALLGAYRMFVEPTVNGAQEAVKQARAGNFGLENQPEYDAQGNYKPSMVSSIADAIPVAGPWSRNIETDAQQQGIAPALAGMGTDLLAAKVAGKATGAALRLTGKGLQLASTTPQAAKLAATRALVPGTPGELL